MIDRPRSVDTAAQHIVRNADLLSAQTIGQEIALAVRIQPFTLTGMFSMRCLGRTRDEPLLKSDPAAAVIAVHSYLPSSLAGSHRIAYAKTKLPQAATTARMYSRARSRAHTLHVGMHLMPEHNNMCKSFQSSLEI